MNHQSHIIPTPRSLITACICAGFVMCWSASTLASPWVLPENTTILQLQYRTETAEKEFLPDGDNQDFPLNGKFSAQSVELGLRHGFGHRIEGAMKLVYKSVDYTADPIFITSANSNGDAVAISPIFDFSEQIEGLADLHFAFRYNAIKGAVLVTPEIELKIPTGYDKPSGTFVRDDPGLLDADAADPNGVIPSGDVPIEDDLTLGDGQVDVTASLLIGTFISATKTFARASGGFRLRFNGPGEQVIWGVKVGQLIGEYFVVFAETNGTHTIIEGDVIGLTFATRQPETPALGFPISNFDFVELRTDKNYVDVGGGAILKFDRFEVIFSGGKIVDGSNIAELVYANMGTVYRF